MVSQWCGVGARKKGSRILREPGRNSEFCPPRINSSSISSTPPQMSIHRAKQLCQACPSTTGACSAWNWPNRQQLDTPLPHLSKVHPNLAYETSDYSTISFVGCWRALAHHKILMGTHPHWPQEDWFPSYSCCTQLDVPIGLTSFHFGATSISILKSWFSSLSWRQRLQETSPYYILWIIVQDKSVNIWLERTLELWASPIPFECTKTSFGIPNV